MNKYQEALNILKPNDHDIKHHEDGWWSQQNDAITSIQELVDKETPKKVIETPVSYYCPNCKLDKVYDYESEHKLNRCEECGQKIDWSKDE